LTILTLHCTLNNITFFPDQVQLSDPVSEVAFHVNLKESTFFDYLKPVTFDDVITNIGGAYDVTSGVFTAPVFGTYLFSLTLVCGPNSAMHVGIMKNDRTVFSSLCNGRNDAQNQNGGTTIIHLDKDDRVNVALTFPVRGYEEMYGYHMTSFSGYLLNKA